jgi:hypothetical protein
MNPKPDGRLYSRVLRRSVAIFNFIGPNKQFTSRDLAQDIYDQKLPVFLLSKTNTMISVNRINDYLRFLSVINAFILKDHKLQLAFPLKSNDREWAIKFSDLAWSYLAKKTKQTNQEFQTDLQTKINALHQENRLPMLSEVFSEFDLVGGRDEEHFRWALYLYTDGENCPFDIRHFPVLTRKGQ